MAEVKAVSLAPAYSQPCADALDAVPLRTGEIVAHRMIGVAATEILYRVIKIFAARLKAECVGIQLTVAQKIVGRRARRS